MLDTINPVVQRERVSDDVYVFTSGLYAQVTAGVIISSEGAILIDTLPFPRETRRIKHFVEDELSVPVRYIINTHYHADHTYGNFLFPKARVVGHALCRQLQIERGIPGLKQVKANVRELREVEIVLPDLTFSDGYLNLHLGKRILSLYHSPGHSADGIAVILRGERILFAGDTMMPIPYIGDGDLDDFIASLRIIPTLKLENAVQGHGGIVLRGEITGSVEANVIYLETIREMVREIVENEQPYEALDEITLESLGKSRLPLGGDVIQLHRSNLETLYWRLKPQETENEGRGDGETE